MSKQLTPHFTVSELACRCGCGMLPTQELLDFLEAVRLIYGRPIHIASGARCEAHNQDVGGAPDSAHTRGTAVDPAAPMGEDLLDLIAAIMAVQTIRKARGAKGGGFGMGVKNGVRCIHADVDEKHGWRAWMY